MKPIGITPAYAGKSIGGSDANKCPRDHPRVCGEKPGCITGSSGSPGSPPRMRGKAVKILQLPAVDRITPAYAGKSPRALTRRIMTGDHPRVCGEKLRLTAKETPCRGSPPRMRGKAALSASAAGSEGITPAYAGKRAPFQKKSTPGRDHPRVCGEKSANAKLERHAVGSPPRMRGKD